MARHPYPIQTIRLRQPLAAPALEAALAGAAPDATLKGARGRPGQGMQPANKAWWMHLVLTGPQVWPGRCAPLLPSPCI